MQRQQRKYHFHCCGRIREQPNYFSNKRLVESFCLRRNGAHLRVFLLLFDRPQQTETRRSGKREARHAPKVLDSIQTRDTAVTQHVRWPAQPPRRLKCFPSSPFAERCVHFHWGCGDCMDSSHTSCHFTAHLFPPFPASQQFPCPNHMWDY